MEFEKKVVELDVNDVLPNRFQPRIKFNEDSINELSESIKEHGVIQPIVVRPMGDKYEIIAGERRYKATLLSGIQKIPAIITNLNDKDSAEVALIENVQRKDLTPIEEAISYKKILDMGYLTQEELASKLGKNQSTVANKLRLLNLAEDVQEAVLEEKISERHARSLLKLSNQNQQLEMLNKIIDNRLTVRKTDEEIAKMLKPEPIVIEDETEFNPFKIEPMKTSVEATNNEEEGAQKMNDIFDPFKLNTASNEEAIIEDKEVLDFNPFAPVEDSAKTIEEPTKLPGFMDVSQIEQNAQDINQDKPEVNISSLLTPDFPVDEKLAEEESTVEEEPAVQVEPIEETKEELSSNKFFNLPFNDEPESEYDPFAPLESSKVQEQPVEESKEESIPVVSSNGNDMFNFNFDNIESSVPEVKEETPLSQEPIESSSIKSEPVESSNELPKMPSFDDMNSFNSAPMGEELPVPTLTVPSNKNMMEAINLIRNCSRDLEKLGFDIDVEEIDFEKEYQVVIKIEK